MQINYPSATTPADWYAPETLLAGAGVLVLTWGLKRLLGLVYGRLTRKDREEPSALPEDFPDEQATTAAAYPGAQRTAAVLGYSVLLILVTQVLMYVLGEHTSNGAGESLLIASVKPGLPAAVAFLSPAAGLLAASSFLVTILALHYGVAIVRTGLLAVLWLFTLVGAFLLGGLLAGLILPPLGQALYAAAGGCGVAGLWVRFGQLIGGKNTGTLVREKLTRAQWKHAQQVKGKAAPRGEYVDHTPQVRRLPTMGPGSRTEIQPEPFVSRLRWAESGVEVEWSDQRAGRFAWGELTKLRYTTLGYDLEGAVVSTASGDSLRLPESGKNYRVLTATLEVHIWGREKPKGQD